MKFSGKKDGYPWRDLDHPTPLHIKARVTQAMVAEAIARGDCVPVWVFEAMDKGIAQACREHNEGKV